MSEKITNTILKIRNVWPFNHFPAIRLLNLHLERPCNYHRFCRLARGDKLNLFFLNFTVLVPVEERRHVIDSAEVLLKKYYDTSIIFFNHFNSDHKNKLAEEKFTPYRFSYHRLGSCFIDPKFHTGIKYMEVFYMRISESFLVFSFNVMPDDRVQYTYNRIANYNHSIKIEIHFLLRKIFKSWGYTEYPETKSYFQAHYSFLKERRADFANLLKKNGIDYFLGDEKEIPAVVVFAFKREEAITKKILYRQEKILDFWDCIGIPNEGEEKYSTFSDESHTYYIPESNINADDKLSNLTEIYVDQKKLELSNNEAKTEDFLNEIMHDWVTYLDIILCYHSFIDFVYSKVKQLRVEYYSRIHKKEARIKKILPMVSDIEEQLYWYTLARQQLKNVLTAAFQHAGFPELNYTHKNVAGKTTYTWHKGAEEAISRKVKFLNEIIPFYSESIDRYKELVETKTNLKIQKWIIILTIITAFAAIIQIIGWKNIDNTIVYVFKNLANWITTILESCSVSKYVPLSGDSIKYIK